MAVARHRVVVDQVVFKKTADLAFPQNRRVRGLALPAGPK